MPNDVRRLSVLAPRVVTADGQRLAENLARMGFTVVPPSAGIDVAVVVVTPTATADAGWCRRLVEVAEARLVPVAVDGGLGPLVSATDERLAAVVGRLREASWVAHDRDAPGAAAAAVAAAVRSDLGQHAAALQLERAAQAWERGGFADDALVVGARAARRQEAWVRDHAADPLLAPSDLARAYAARSSSAARRQMWRSRLRGAGALVSVGALVFVLLGLRAVVLDGARRNALSVGTLAEQGVQDQRSWSALLAGALLLSGDVVEQDMARQTLRDQLPHLTFLGDLKASGRVSLEAAAPLDGGAEVAMVISRPEETDLFGVYDVNAGRLAWSVELGAEGWNLALGAEGRIALVAGPSSAAIVDLEEREVEPVEGAGRTDLVAVDDAGRVAALATLGGGLARLDLTSGRLRTVGFFAAVHDVRATVDGGLRALVDEEDGRPALIDTDGEVLATAEQDAPVIPQGAVVPDRIAAYVVGPDRQLWDLSPEGFVPTGMAVPDAVGVALAVGGDRVVTGGVADEPHVRHVPTGADLGPLCPELSYPGFVVPSPDDGTLACTSSVRGTLWATPPGPLDDPPDPPPPDLDVTSGEVRVRARDNEIRIDIEGIDHASGWRPVTPGRITSLVVAPDGPQVAVGTLEGDLVVFDWTAPEAPRVVDWHTPDGAGVEALSWDEDGLVVHTGANRAWVAPSCDLCGSDDGLLEELRRRIPRCWNDVQLQAVDAAAREELGVHECFERGG